MFDLKEEDEDQFNESLLNKSMQSIQSGDNEIKIQDDQLLLNNPKHKLKLFLKKDEQIQNYLKTFFNEDKQEESFNFFFNEFIKVYHSELIGYKFFSWDIFILSIHKNYRLQMFILILLNFLNQMTGVNCFIFYSKNLLLGMDIDKNLTLFNFCIGINFININIRNFQFNRSNICTFNNKFNWKKRTYLFRISNSKYNHVICTNYDYL